jgi:mono/diheme cytochrome c family protein
MNGLATVTRGGLLALLAVLSAAPAQPAEQKDPAAAAAPAARPGPPSPPPPLTLSARPSAKGGERLYVQYCGMCHGKGGMGTGLLARRTDRPLLEERNDLTVDYVIQAARTASATCPPSPEAKSATRISSRSRLTSPLQRRGVGDDRP